jgi:hypothetical protein
MTPTDKPRFKNQFLLCYPGQYKFVLAMENAVSDEYMTEKLWRNIHVGAVPIYYGSSKQKVDSTIREKRG